MVNLFHLWCLSCIWFVLLISPYSRADGLGEEIKKCVDRKLQINSDLPFQIVNDKGELELWIEYNNNYLLPEPNWYSCPYGVTEDESKVNVTLESFLRQIIYSVDKSTKAVTFIKSESGLYGPTQEKAQLECISDIEKALVNYRDVLPVEVNRVENHLEVTVKYQGKYDFYNAISLGSICGVQYQLSEKPTPTVEEYGHCSKCGNSAELYAWCPFKIQETDLDVIITFEAFFYKNVYTVNKSTREVQFEKSLIGKDPRKEFETQINSCKERSLQVNFTLPIQIIRNDNFLEIWIKRTDKYDIFETSVSGSICKQDLQSERDPNVLVPRAPAECLEPGVDVPYYFICPYDALQDEDFVYFKVHGSGDQFLYAFNKSNGTLAFHQYPTLYDSGTQNTLTYLRSVVDMDPGL